MPSSTVGGPFPMLCSLPPSVAASVIASRAGLVWMNSSRSCRGRRSFPRGCSFRRFQALRLLARTCSPMG
eukprot:6313511-Alexandrium_andersonii.AAC.1